MEAAKHPASDMLAGPGGAQTLALAAQELAQHGVNMPDEAGRATQTGIEQYPPIVCHRAVPVREIAHRLQCDRNSPPVELQESRREAVELPSRAATGLNP